jgi:asparagine synthase (glutamine-hydrolysing)
VHPFLSKGILDIAKTLPDAAKRDAKGAKPILRRLASKYVPRNLVYDKKYDFNSPAADWLKSPLSGWLEILHDDVTRARGIFDSSALARCTVDADRGLIIAAATLEIFFRNFVDRQA